MMSSIMRSCRVSYLDATQPVVEGKIEIAQPVEEERIESIILPDVGAAPSQPREVIIEMNASMEPQEEHTYKMEVHNGYIGNVNSDGNVVFAIHGEDGNMKEYPFTSLKGTFQSEKISQFMTKSQNLGVIHKITIRLDSTQTGPRWFLSKIIVTDTNSGEVFEFTHKDWVFTTEEDKELVLEIDAESVSFELDPMITRNHMAHHTNKFKCNTEIKPLILRRGESFYITIKLSRPFKEKDDAFYFTMLTGKRPRFNDNSLVNIEKIPKKDFMQFKSNRDRWGYTILDNDKPKDVQVEIYIPPAALVSNYQLLVETNDRTACQYDEVYILFNPWCQNDEVYMKNEAERREYIVKQHGVVYVGSPVNPRPRKWYFGQFESACLEAAFNLLEKTIPAKRATAVDVSRLMSSLVNSCDNNGVLAGNWSGDYSDGIAPGSWTSSPPILEQYTKTKESVKFGQCWVFSCVLTTVMRTLGISCRPVTNFASAHDSNGNCSHEVYFDKEGENIPGMGSDSIWNFHVWNDVWMTRHDLPPGYGGWQAIDATPQERSRGLFQMGPASHKAIREGEVNLPCDTRFVLAEVNADVFMMQKNKNGEWEVLQRNKTAVGKSISTKAVNSDEREDITGQYKWPEYSILEREVIRKAMIKSENKYLNERTVDKIRFELSHVEDSVSAGEDAEIRCKVTNTSTNVVDVAVMFNVEITRNDGLVIAQLPKKRTNRPLAENTNADVNYIAVFKQYANFLGDEIFIHFYCTAIIPDTYDIIKLDHVVDIVKPTLRLIQLPPQLKADVESTFKISFHNPLNETLTECEVVLDGTIISKRKEFKKLRNAAPMQIHEEVISITPDKLEKAQSKKSMNVNFLCKQLGGISEMVKLNVVQ